MPRKYIKVAERKRMEKASGKSSSSSSRSSSTDYQRGVAQGKTLEDVIRTRWTQVAEKQLSRWRRRDEYGYFHEPVNPEYAPGYHRVVKKPMDFSTMQTKMSTNKYKKYKEFASDFSLICNNCMKYNPEDSPFHKFARQMLDVGNRAIAASSERFKEYDVRIKKEKKAYDKVQRIVREKQKMMDRQKIKDEKRKMAKTQKRKEAREAALAESSESSSEEDSSTDSSSEEASSSSEEEEESEDEDGDEDEEETITKKRGRGRPRKKKPSKKKVKKEKDKKKRKDTRKNHHKKQTTSEMKEKSKKQKLKEKKMKKLKKERKKQQALEKKLKKQRKKLKRKKEKKIKQKKNKLKKSSKNDSNLKTKELKLPNGIGGNMMSMMNRMNYNSNGGSSSNLGSSSSSNNNAMNTTYNRNGGSNGGSNHLFEEDDDVRNFWNFVTSYVHALPIDNTLDMLSIDYTPYVPPHEINWRSRYAFEDDEIEPTFRGYEISEWMELREMLRGPDLRPYPSQRILLEGVDASSMGQTAASSTGAVAGGLYRSLSNPEGISILNGTGRSKKTTSSSSSFSSSFSSSSSSSSSTSSSISSSSSSSSSSGDTATSAKGGVRRVSIASTSSSSSNDSNVSSSLGTTGMLSLTLSKSLGLLEDTTISHATSSDADAILHVNRVNKRYSNDVPYTSEDYKAAIDTKNEFFLMARRGVGSIRRPTAVGVVNYYCMWFTGSREERTKQNSHKSQASKKNGKNGKKINNKTKRSNGGSISGRLVPARAMYIATLQAVKPESHPELIEKNGKKGKIGKATKATKATKKIKSSSSNAMMKKSDAANVDNNRNMSQSKTGVVLMCCALEHARNLGMQMAVLDATESSVSFYRDIFGFVCIEPSEPRKYVPMMLHLRTFCPSRPLLARGQRTMSQTTLYPLPAPSLNQDQSILHSARARMTLVVDSSIPLRTLELEQDKETNSGKRKKSNNNNNSSNKKKKNKGNATELNIKQQNHKIHSIHDIMRAPNVAVHNDLDGGNGPIYGLDPILKPPLCMALSVHCGSDDEDEVMDASDVLDVNGRRPPRSTVGEMNEDDEKDEEEDDDDDKNEKNKKNEKNEKNDGENVETDSDTIIATGSRQGEAYLQIHIESEGEEDEILDDVVEDTEVVVVSSSSLIHPDRTREERPATSWERGQGYGASPFRRRPSLWNQSSTSVSTIEDTSDSNNSSNSDGYSNDDVMERCNLLPPDVRAAEGWHEVDEVCDELRRTHMELMALHQGRENNYRSLLSKSSSFLVEESKRIEQFNQHISIEKKFWRTHREWLKRTAGRRAEEVRVARAKLDQRGNEYRASMDSSYGENSKNNKNNKNNKNSRTSPNNSSNARRNPKNNASPTSRRTARTGAGRGRSSSQAGGPRHQALQRKLKKASLRRVITGTLDILRQHSSAWLFLQPVDADGLGIAHYNEVVKHPMDLSTMQRQFEEEHKYKRAEIFASDVLLMCQNCVLFNSRDAKSMKFVRMAKLMWKKFVKTLKLFMIQENIVFTQPAMLDDEDQLEVIDTVCSCDKPYNCAEFVVACDGECGGWYHPNCVGLIRCGDFLIAVDETTGMETTRFNLSKPFVCPMCSSNGARTTYGEAVFKTPSRSNSGIGRKQSSGVVVNNKGNKNSKSNNNKSSKRYKKGETGTIVPPRSAEQERDEETKRKKGGTNSLNKISTSSSSISSNSNSSSHTNRNSVDVSKKRKRKQDEDEDEDEDDDEDDDEDEDEKTKDDIRIGKRQRHLTEWFS